MHFCKKENQHLWIKIPIEGGLHWRSHSIPLKSLCVFIFQGERIIVSLGTFWLIYYDAFKRLINQSWYSCAKTFKLRLVLPVPPSCTCKQGKWLFRKPPSVSQYVSLTWWQHTQVNVHFISYHNTFSMSKEHDPKLWMLWKVRGCYTLIMVCLCM